MTAAAKPLVCRYTDRLKSINRCPVCGGDFSHATHLTRRFACGAAFSYSKITMGIEAADPCPTPSRIQAAQLTAEAEENSAEAGVA